MHMGEYVKRCCIRGESQGTYTTYPSVVEAAHFAEQIYCQKVQKKGTTVQILRACGGVNDCSPIPQQLIFDDQDEPRNIKQYKLRKTNVTDSN